MQTALTSNTRFLVFKAYESGLCNAWMSLELAVGLAHLTGRSLVLYGSVGEHKRIARIHGGAYRLPDGHLGVLDEGRHPTLLDLLDALPIEVVDYAAFQKAAGSHGEDSNSVQQALDLFGCVFASSKGSAPDGDDRMGKLSAFSDGRTVIVDPVEDVWHLTGKNLGFYSRFFFEPRPSLYPVLERFLPAKSYREIADKVVASLGDYNAVHIRLTDFKRFLPQQDNYGRVVTETLRAIFSPDELLVISTDDADDADFFSAITDAFPRHLFLDRYILASFGDELKSLPFRNSHVLGLICNQVLWHARDFAGTPGSTFTGIAQRYWFRNRLRVEPNSVPTWKFISSGIAGAEADVATCFANGVYSDVRSGPYSWNRVRIPHASSTLSWYREWPEAILV